MKKDFDETLSNQLREIYARFHQQQKEAIELLNILKEEPDFLKLLSETPPWSYFYELPYKTFLAIGIFEFELADITRKAANSDNPIKTFLEETKDTDIELNKDEELSDEEKAFKATLYIATTYQLSSIAIHSQPLSHLIEKAREGNDKALFDAILVDQSILAAPTVARRIQTALLEKDGKFIDLLSRAIKGCRPKRENRDKSLDDLRYMIEVMDEQTGLRNLTYNELYDVLSDDLELYDKSLDGFIKVIQRRNKKHRT